MAKIRFVNHWVFSSIEFRHMHTEISNKTWKITCRTKTVLYSAKPKCQSWGWLSLKSTTKLSNLQLNQNKQTFNGKMPLVFTYNGGIQLKVTYLSNSWSTNSEDQSYIIERFFKRWAHDKQTPKQLAQKRMIFQLTSLKKSTDWGHWIYRIN